VGLFYNIPHKRDKTTSSHTNVTSTCHSLNKSDQFPPIYWRLTVAVCDRRSGTCDMWSYCASPPWL